MGIPPEKCPGGFDTEIWLDNGAPEDPEKCPGGFETEIWLDNGAPEDLEPNFGPGGLEIETLADCEVSLEAVVVLKTGPSLGDALIPLCEDGDSDTGMFGGREGGIRCVIVCRRKALSSE